MDDRCFSLLTFLCCDWDNTNDVWSNVKVNGYPRLIVVVIRVT